MSIEPKHEMFNDDHLRRLQTITDLRTARGLIAKGWCQGASWKRSNRLFRSPRVNYCVTGAMGVACQSSWPRAIEMVNAVYDAVFPGQVVDAFENRTAALQLWNDEAGRGKLEILAAFDRAIIHLTA